MKRTIDYVLQLLIITASILSSLKAYTQISNVHTFSGQPLTEKRESDDLQGSPYFTSNWQTGILIYENERIENTKMKYNVFEDQIEILYNDQAFVPNKELVHGFEFPQLESGKLRTYKFKNGFEGDGISKKNYLDIIYQGKDLMLAERIKMDKLKVTPAVYGEKEYTQLSLTKNYVLIKNGVAQKFKPSKKNFINQFPDKEVKLKNYFKTNNAELDDYEDLAKVMAFIEE